MKKLNASLLVFFVGIVSVSTVWAKNLAGFVIVSVGDVVAHDLETQQSRKLKRRSKIFEGDEIRTGENSKVQLKFKDKGVISLQENTSLQITEYVYTGQSGGSEKSFFKLVKGSFRAISGAIGKQNPEDYRVDTPLATIGIRGTHYKVASAERLAVSVLQGAVEVSNSGGSITIGDNFNYRNAVVNGPGQMPVGSMEPVKVLNTKKSKQTKPLDADEQIDSETTQDPGQEEDSTPHQETSPSEGEDMKIDSSRLLLEGNSTKEELGQALIVGGLDPSLKDNSLVGARVDDAQKDALEPEIDPETHAGGDNTGGANNGGASDTGDNRLSSTELAELGPYWGLASEAAQPVSTDPNEGFVGGLARDGNNPPGLIVDKGIDPNDPNYANLPILHVLRQGTHTNSQNNFARFDQSVDTSTSELAWGQWSGGTAQLFSDASDASLFTPITSDIYWITAKPSFSIPTSGEAHFNQTFLLAGQGSAGLIIDDDPASVAIQFTLNWQTMTFNNGEFHIKTGNQNDLASQTQWKFFNLSGSLTDTNGSSSPALTFNTPPVGEVCVGLCSVPTIAEGEIRAILLDGNNQIGGNFTFWEQGNLSEWVTGVFAVGAEERYTTTEASSLDHRFFGVFQRHPNDSNALTTSALMRGKSQAPTAGDFLMVDFLEPSYGAVIRLGSGLVETDYPGASASVHGHTIEWGAWNGSSVDLDFSGAPSFETERYTWITYVPIDAATMDSLSAQVSFSLPYAFYGWQYNSADGSQVPLELQHGYFNVDLAGDTLAGNFVFYGLGRFDVAFSGSTMGDGITVESSSAFYNGAPVSIWMDGQYIGSSFAEGLVGGFKIADLGDINVYASGVYGFGRDDRLTSAEIAAMDQVAFMSIDAQDVSFPEVKAGIANTPAAGIFNFRTFEVVNSEVYRPILSVPQFNSAMLGSIPVDWGVWDDVSGTANIQDNPIDSSSVIASTDAISWVVGTPADPADIPTTGVTAYNNIVGFAGYENSVPLNTPTTGDITMSVDFANQTFNTTMNISASANTWNMSYSGALEGSKLSATGSGLYNGSQAASGVVNAVLVGTGATTGGAGPEGIMGAFKNQVDANPAIHSSGVFVLEQ